MDDLSRSKRFGLSDPPWVGAGLLVDFRMVTHETEVERCCDRMSTTRSNVCPLGFKGINDVGDHHPQNDRTKNYDDELKYLY